MVIIMNKYKILISVGFYARDGAGVSTQIIEYDTKEEAIAVIEQIKDSSASKEDFLMRAYPLWKVEN